MGKQYGVFCEGNPVEWFDTEKDAQKYLDRNTESWREPLFNWEIKPSKE